MNSVINKNITHFSNNRGSVKLSKLANAYVVAVEPKYGDNIVNSHDNSKSAEIDYSYFVHYFTKKEV